jgi:hypothetical protein
MQSVHLSSAHGKFSKRIMESQMGRSYIFGGYVTCGVWWLSPVGPSELSSKLSNVGEVLEVLEVLLVVNVTLYHRVNCSTETFSG